MADQFKEVIQVAIETLGQADASKLEAALRRLGDSGESADSQLGPLVDRFEELGETSAKVARSIDLSRQLKANEEALAAARKRVEELNSEFNRADKSSEAITAAFRAADKEVKSLAGEQHRLQTALAKSNAALDAAGVDTTDLAKASAALKTEAAGVAAQITKTADATAKAGSVSQKLGAAFQSARDGVNAFASGLLKITGIAGVVSSALGAISLGRLFGGAVQSARDFEATLSEVQAVSGATTQQLQRMRAASEAASETTKFTAQEAAQALGELARASGDADAAIAQLPATLNLAQAAGLSASEAATILTTSITQFGEGADQASRYADLFTREANSTSDSVESLGNAMSYAAPLARQLGLSVEQTTAVLGALAEQGFKGERAGTALRNVFSALLDPSTEFRAELARLNITSSDFGTIIEQLAAAGADGQRALLSLDAAARPAIAALVTSGGAGIRRLTDDFRNAGGEAERTAQKMGENFAGASSRLRNAFDALRRSLIDPILEPLAKQFDEVAKRIRAFADSDDFTRLKNSVREFVTGATQSLVDFISKVDFGSVADKASAFTQSAGQFFRDLGRHTEEAARVIGIAGSAISAAYNTIQTAILTAAGVVTGSLTAISKAALFAIEGLSRLNGTAAALQPVFDAIRQKIGALEAITTEFANRAQTNLGEAGDAFRQLGHRIVGVVPASDKAAAALRTLGIQGELTKEKALQLSQQFLLLPAALQRVIEPGLRAAGVFDLLAQKAPEAAGKVADAANKSAESIEKLPEAAEELAEPVDNSGLVEPIQEVGEQAEESTSQMSSSFAEAANAFAAFSAQFAATSENAAKRFRDLTWNIKEFGIAQNQILQADGSGLGKFFDSMFVAAEMVTKEIEEQRQQMLVSVQAIEAMDSAAVNAWSTIRGGSEQAAESMRFLADEARNGRSEFDLLGANDLGPLADALDAAADKVRELEDRAFAARDALRGIADSLQDEIDRMRGNDRAIEDRRHEEQLRRIEEEFEAAGQLGSAEYREAKRRAEELHRLKLRQIEEEKRAREEAQDAGNRPRPDRSGDEAAGDVGPGSGNGGGGRGGRGGVAAVNVTINGPVIGGTAAQIREQLARWLGPELERIGRNSR